jgi:hypothetical protein
MAKGSGQGSGKRHSHSEYLDLFRQGVSPLEIARRLDVTDGAVYVQLGRDGIHQRRTKKLHAEDFPKVIEMYKSGMSMREIALEYNMCAEVLRRRFVEWGIPRRSLKDSVPRGEQNRFYNGGIHEKNRSSRDKEPRRMSWQVAAICLGHPLPNDWIVHHMDNNPGNNDPDNIWIFPDRKSHSRYHMELTRNRYKGLASDTTQMALGSGAVKLPPPPAPIVFSPDTNPLDLFEKLRLRVAALTT